MVDTNSSLLSIIFPVHNEEDIVEVKTVTMISYLERHSLDFEIVLCENGSTDGTLGIIRRLASRYRQISYDSLPMADFSSAVIQGVRKAKSEKIVWMGIDYSAEIKFVIDAYRALDTFDIVLGSKKLGKDYRHLLRKFISRSYNTLVRLIFGLPYADVEGYQAYRKSKVSKLWRQISAPGHLFNLELLLAARRHGLSVTEIPIDVYEVRRSKYLGDIVKLAKAIAISLKEFVRLKISYG